MAFVVVLEHTCSITNDKFVFLIEPVCPEGHQQRPWIMGVGLCALGSGRRIPRRTVAEAMAYGGPLYCCVESGPLGISFVFE